MTARGIVFSGFLASSPNAVAASNPTRLKIGDHDAESERGERVALERELIGIDREAVVAEDDERQHQ